MVKKAGYFLAVIAMGSLISILGCSDDKATNQFTPGPDAPTNLVGWALSTSSIRLTWQDNSDDESLFVVYRRQSGPWAAVATVAAGQIAVIYHIS